MSIQKYMIPIDTWVYPVGHDRALPSTISIRPSTISISEFSYGALKTIIDWYASFISVYNNGITFVWLENDPEFKGFFVMSNNLRNI